MEFWVTSGSTSYSLSWTLASSDNTTQIEDTAVLDDTSIDFPPSKTPQETIFSASAHFDSVRQKAEQAFADILREHSRMDEKPQSWWDKLFNKDQSFEDKLADLIIVLLKCKPESWRFSAENPPQAKFEEMRITVNFASVRELRFQIRSIDDKISYSGIKASSAKRKELYNVIQRAREHKVLSAITKEVEKQVFAITDQRAKK